VILGAPTIDKLIAEGKLVAGSRADIAKSGIGIAVRSGLPKPDISSSEAVKNAMLAANSILRGRAAFILPSWSKKWASPIRSRRR